jgi:hypothetical protein
LDRTRHAGAALRQERRAHRPDPGPARCRVVPLRRGDRGLGAAPSRGGMAAHAARAALAVRVRRAAVRRGLLVVRADGAGAPRPRERAVSGRRCADGVGRVPASTSGVAGSSRGA